MTTLHVFFQDEDRQKAANNLGRVQQAFQLIGASDEEVKAIFCVLAAVYHLGVAGAAKGWCMRLRSDTILLRLWDSLLLQNHGSLIHVVHAREVWYHSAQTQGQPSAAEPWIFDAPRLVSPS